MGPSFKAWAKQEADRLGTSSRGDVQVERAGKGSWYSYGYKVVTPDRAVVFFLPFDSRVELGDVLRMGTEKWKVLDTVSVHGGFHCAVERLHDVSAAKVQKELEEGSKDERKSKPHSSVKENPDIRKVFVIHGRDKRLRSGMFSFLRAIGLSPLEWTEAVALTRKAAPYIGEILDAAFGHAQAVVVMFTPDDEARLRVSLRRGNDSAYESTL